MYWTRFLPERFMRAIVSRGATIDCIRYAIREQMNRLQRMSGSRNMAKYQADSPCTITTRAPSFLRSHASIHPSIHSFLLSVHRRQFYASFLSFTHFLLHYKDFLRSLHSTNPIITITHFLQLSLFSSLQCVITNHTSN